MLSLLPIPFLRGIRMTYNILMQWIRSFAFLQVPTLRDMAEIPPPPTYCLGKALQNALHKDKPLLPLKFTSFSHLALSLRSTSLLYYLARSSRSTSTHYRLNHLDLRVHDESQQGPGSMLNFYYASAKANERSPKLRILWWRPALLSLSWTPLRSQARSWWQLQPTPICPKLPKAITSTRLGS